MSLHARLAARREARIADMERFDREGAELGRGITDLARGWRTEDKAVNVHVEKRAGRTDGVSRFHNDQSGKSTIGAIASGWFGAGSGAILAATIYYGIKGDSGTPAVTLVEAGLVSGAILGLSATGMYYSLGLDEIEWRPKKWVIKKEIAEKIGSAQEYASSKDQSLGTLTQALDLSESALALAKEIGYKRYRDVEAAVASIQKTVLPRVQELGFAECEERLRAVPRLNYENRYADAIRSIEEVQAIFDSSRLSREPITDANRSLQKRITEERLDTAMSYSVDALTWGREWLGRNGLSDAVAWLKISVSEAKVAQDLQTKAGEPILADLYSKVAHTAETALNDPRILNYLGQKASAEAKAEAEDRQRTEAEVQAEIDRRNARLEKQRQEAAQRYDKDGNLKPGYLPP